MEKQIKNLQIITTILSVILIALVAFIAYSYYTRSKFDVLNVERINVNGQDGKVRLVISNEERQHPGIINGKELPHRQRPAGMIFFNNDGDECGGLIYDGNKKSASFTLSIDKYNNDQLMQLQYSQEKAKGDSMKRSYGMKFWDRSDRFTAADMVDAYNAAINLKDKNAVNDSLKSLKSKGMLGQDRMFIGKNESGQYGMFIKDSKGIPRLNLYVDKDDNVVIQKFDRDKKITEQSSL